MKRNQKLKTATAVEPAKPATEKPGQLELFSNDNVETWGDNKPEYVGSFSSEELFYKPEKQPVELYDYQKEGHEKFAKWWERDDSPESLIALTVGMGKTITACKCVDHVISQGAKVLWLTHREELLSQSKAEIEALTGEFCSIEKAEHKAAYRSKIVIASVQTLKGRRLEKFAGWFRPSLIVCDEAHHSLAQTWMAIKTVFFDSRVLNLTATPYRSDVGMRLNLGEVLIEKNTTDGIKMGRLVPPKPVGKLELNLGKVKKALGDYEVKSLGEFLSQPAILKASAELVRQHFKGRKTILFAANVSHGRDISNELRSLGVRVDEVFGTTPTELRRESFRKIREGETDVLVNNLVLTEGFNLPELDMVVILRPTKNAALYLQMLGRGLRTSDGKKDCLVLDIIDTAKRKTAEDSFILPSEEDRKKYSALAGRTESLGSTFISWFFPREEVHTKLLAGEDTHQCVKIDSGEGLFSAFFDRPADGWRPYQNKVIGELDNIFKAPGTSGDGTDYDRVFNSIRCGNHDAFVRLMGRKGWMYCPHGHVPQTTDELKTVEEALFKKESEKAAYTFETLISQDANLKNFIMDIFGGEEDLGEQARKYYELHRVEGIPVVWYKPIDVKGAGFCFFEPHRGKIWVRTRDGSTFCFKTGGGFISPAPKEKLTIHVVPVYNKSTQWANEEITDKQSVQVAKILKISEQDLAGAKISRLSASALMSASWTKRYLSKISSWLAKNHVDDPERVAAQAEASEPSESSHPDQPNTAAPKPPAEQARQDNLVDNQQAGQSDVARRFKSTFLK